MDRPNYRKVNVKCCLTCKYYVESDQMALEITGTCGTLNEKMDNYVESLMVCDNYEKTSTGSKRITKWYKPKEFNRFEDTYNEDWMQNKILHDSSLVIIRDSGKIALFRKEGIL